MNKARVAVNKQRGQSLGQNQIHTCARCGYIFADLLEVRERRWVRHVWQRCPRCRRALFMRTKADIKWLERKLDEEHAANAGLQDRVKELEETLALYQQAQAEAVAPRAEYLQ